MGKVSSEKIYDVAVIGGGIVGCAVLEKLSHHEVEAVLLERGEDVALGATRANSGIIHAGFDAENGTKKARFNVRGNEMFHELCMRLKVPFLSVGTLVLAGADGVEALERLIENGRKNGVKRLELLTREQIIQIEPNAADGIEYALYAPGSGVVSPFAVAIALAESAMANEMAVKLNSEVTAIKSMEKGFEIGIPDGVVRAKVVVNCAGANAAAVNKLAGAEEFETEFRRGDYFLFDRAENRLVNRTCFMLPTSEGKGVLATPAADGTVLVGPTSMTVSDGDDTAVHSDGLEKIKQTVPIMLKNLDFKKCIRVFAGVRAISGNDFIVENSARVKNFITVGGICSPGLTAAPAIAEYVVDTLLKSTGLKLKPKKRIKENPMPVVTAKLDFAHWEKLAAVDRNYSTIVCRCEKITYGEVVAALESPLKPTSLDAVKRRCRAGMGRCQGGFCTPVLMDLLAAELGIPKEEVTKCGRGTEAVIRSGK